MAMLNAGALPQFNSEPDELSNHVQFLEEVIETRELEVSVEKGGKEDTSDSKGGLLLKIIIIISNHSVLTLEIPRGQFVPFCFVHFLWNPIHHPREYLGKKEN